MASAYPNLFIPGAAKSGTSSLHELLNQHPDICMSSHKEPSFWTSDNFHLINNKRIKKYLNYFNTKPNAIYKGESSTTYMLFPGFKERIKEHYNTKDLRFIFILRNPIDRIYSHYWYVKGVGSENLNLKKAILKDKNLEPNFSHELPEGRFKNYFQYGLYGKWLTSFYESFDESQIKILIFEDFKNNPLKTANECFDFLNLSPINTLQELDTNETAIIKYQKLYKSILKITQGNIKLMKPIYLLIPRFIKTKIKHNISDIIIKYTKTNKKYPKLSPNDRLWIKDMYKDDFELLKKVTGKNFNLWKDFN
ncbi:sulfotransferase family protein [Psychroserpens sp.]